MWVVVGGVVDVTIVVVVVVHVVDIVNVGTVVVVVGAVNGIHDAVLEEDPQRQQQRQPQWC